MQTFQLGVGDLIHLVLRSGSLDNRGSGSFRRQEGTRIHNLIQNRDQKLKKNYQKEVYFKHQYNYKDYEFILTGRADAIYEEENKIVIEEIKTTTLPKNEEFSESELHRAQLCFYGLFYMRENNLDELDLKLHYYHVNSDESTYFNKTYSIFELTVYINSILDKWLKLGLLRSNWIEIRNNSIKNLDFIYDNFRKGQREMSLAVFNTVKRNDTALIEAPTGIGKTVASLFPSVKSLVNISDHQIFYLTAKTTIQSEAKKALEKMREKGLKAKSLIITAKDKICLNDDIVKNCNPEDCEYALNYFDKVNEILPTCLKTTENFDKDYILDICTKYKICPYQFTFDLSNWSDVVICDYNYVFDPVSKIEDITKKRITLIDEAHNLPDRARDMYSALLSDETFYNLRNILNDKNKKDKLKGSTSLKKKSKEIVSFFEIIENKFVSENGDFIETDEKLLDQLLELLNSLQNSIFLYHLKIQNKKIHPDNEILEAFNETSKAVYRFLVISEIYSQYRDKFKLFISNKSGEIIFKIICLDASDFIEEQLKDIPSVLFSATLTPFDYYKKVLLNEEELPSLNIPSPFKRSHYEVLCDNTISTRYSDRIFTNKKVADDIYRFVKEKKGHYLVFFPSYKYLEEVLQEFNYLKDEQMKVKVQKKDMNDSLREKFINLFRKDKDEWLIGFCVMGGVFSEGVDLPLDELIGTVIIGPGLPGLDFERNLIKDYYEEEIGNGYAFAYAYPGMNRVLQSAGRVIRTEKDKGLILLIDDRFQKPFYKKMLPAHLQPDYLNNSEELTLRVRNFWKRNSLN